MEDVVELIKKIAPESLKTIENRYSILKSIYYNQPIGRRLLSSLLCWSERTLRKEVKCLEELGLIIIERKGMRISQLGTEVISGLEEYILYLKGLTHIASKIKDRFNCKVIIVPGDADINKTTKKQLGDEAACFLKSVLQNGDIIAITGGTTMAQIPKNMIPLIGYEDVIVVPARGGLGEKVEIQANTIAAKLAHKLNANYRLLYIPDNLGDKAMESMINEPGIKEVINIIKKADILLHGIGEAVKMAYQRGFSKSKVNDIVKKGAVAEVLGFYLNKEGEVVYTTTSAGLNIKDLKNIKIVIAVAGGASKAMAIRAFLKYNQPTILITDEGAARGLLDIEGGKIN